MKNVIRKLLKREIYFIIVILFIPFSSPALEPTEKDIFNKANNLYQQDKVKEAINIYEQLVDEEVKSASIYYNLGCAYYRLGKVGPSILNLEKALILAPNDEDIKYNLEFIRSSVFGKSEADEENVFVFVIQWLYGLLSLNQTAVVVILIYITGCGLLLVRIFTEDLRRRTIFMYVIYGLIVIEIPFVLSLGLKVKSELYTERGIVIVEKGELRNGPNRTSEVIFNVSEGAKVVLLKELSGFYLVKNPQLGYRGWIPKQHVGLIEV